MTTTLSLRIADFSILIRFHPTDWTFIGQKTVSELTAFYRPFISAKRDRYDATFDIVEQPRLLFYRKQKTRLVELYREEGKNIRTYYQIGIVQFQYIMNAVLNRLLRECGGFMLHASACRAGKKTAVFCAPSGGGKSTVLKMLQGRYTGFADDSVVVRMRNGVYVTYQSPVIEKESWVKKDGDGYALASLYFLRKARTNGTEKMEDRMKLHALLLEQLIDEGPHHRKTLSSVHRFVSRFRECYTLSFSRDRKELMPVMEAVL